MELAETHHTIGYWTHKNHRIPSSSKEREVLAEDQVINNFSLLSRRGTNTLQYQAFYSRVEYSRYQCSLFSDFVSE
jgi:hypothetical protein